MKQTAVEFSAKSLKDFSHIKHSFRFKELVEQAKEMEKIQIMGAFEQGDYNSVDYFNPENNIKESEQLSSYDVVSSKILIDKKDLLKLITKALKEGFNTYEIVESGLESFDAKAMASYMISKYM